MSTAIFDRGCTVHSDSSTDMTAGFRAPIKTSPPSAETAIERRVAAVPPLSRAGCHRLAALLGGGA